MTKKVKRVKITLSMRCACGYGEDIPDFGESMRVTPGYVSESGTDWPGEIELVCPACKGVDDSRTL